MQQTAFFLLVSVHIHTHLIPAVTDILLKQRSEMSVNVQICLHCQHQCDFYLILLTSVNFAQLKCGNIMGIIL